MALLRNLRGIFSEISDMEQGQRILNQLKKGVPGGKQFPFRYKSAYDAVKACPDLNHQMMILDALEECIDIACDSMPRLSGRTVCLSDNSGSAWESFASSYGTVTVAEINNLSSVITARNSRECFVGKFGDRLQMYGISKRQGVLHQAKQINQTRGNDVGYSTENGIWLFLTRQSARRAFMTISISILISSPVTAASTVPMRASAVTARQDIEAAAMPDHIHLYVAIPPKYSVSEFVGFLKGKSSLMIFDCHANLKYKYGNRHFWCRGYFVETVGRNEKAIQEYVRNQLQEDIASDQMCIKEFKDPFTGEPVVKGK